MRRRRQGQSKGGKTMKKLKEEEVTGRKDGNKERKYKLLQIE
jgi:hypothetical protein